MDNIFKKSRIAWQVLIATALGAYGGYPNPPVWWKQLSKYKLFQFFTVWILVYSCNNPDSKTIDYLWTTVVACIIFFVMLMTQNVSLPDCAMSIVSEEDDAEEEYIDIAPSLKEDKGFVSGNYGI